MSLNAGADSEAIPAVAAADTTDRKTAEEKLQRSEEDLRRVIDAIPQTIVVLDPAGRAVDANQSMLDYTGLTLEAVRSQTFRKQVFHPDDRMRALK